MVSHRGDRESNWLLTKRKGPWEGCANFHQERDVWVRGRPNNESSLSVHWYGIVVLAIFYPPNEVKFLSEIFSCYFFLSLDLPISTRFYALSLARHVCPQIRVFGMELENPCERFVKYLIICKNILSEEPCQKFSCANGFTQSEKLFIQSESVLTPHHQKNASVKNII